MPGIVTPTGLIYLGNGQYYDPATGRFLIRDTRPNQKNPYTPIDPTGMMLAPLALLAMVFGRKKSRGKWDNLVILLVLGLSLGMGLAACGAIPCLPLPQPNRQYLHRQHHRQTKRQGGTRGAPPPTDNNISWQKNLTNFANRIK